MAYDSGWSPIVEFQTGADVNVKLTNAFDNVDQGLAAITANEETLNEIYPLYLYDRIRDLTLATEGQWYELGAINHGTHPKGIYKYEVHSLFLNQGGNDAVVLRYSIDDGLNWREVAIPHAAGRDIYTFNTVATVIQNAADTGLKLRLQAKKLNAGDTVVVYHSDVIIEKKLVTP